MRQIDWGGLSEEAVVDAAKAGNPTAFDVLVHRYRPAAVSVARQIVKRRDLAEDVAQDALITAYKALPRLEDSSKFAGWLGAIVRHRAARVSQRRDELAVRLDEIIAAHMPSLHEEIDIRGEIACAIAELQPDLQAVAELFYLREWTTNQIADFLALPLTTVKWRLHASRQSLRPRLAETLEIRYE